MNREDIVKLFVTTSKKVMIESIDGIDDIKFLKEELKEYIRKNWDLKQEKENLIKYIEKVMKQIETFFLDKTATEEDIYIANIFKQYSNKIYQDILERVNSGKYE